MDQAVEETDVSQIMCNCEAQHRYLTWRAEKVSSSQAVTSGKGHLSDCSWVICVFRII